MYLSCASCKGQERQGVFPFGVAFKRRADSKNYTYIIYPEKLREYCRGKEDEKEKN